MRQRALPVLFFAALGALPSVWSNAAVESPATYTGANGNWGNAANWSTNPVVPIDTGSNIYDVTIASKTVAYNLSGSGQLNMLQLSSGTLNLNSGCNLAILSGGPITQSHITATTAVFSDSEFASQLTSTSLSAQAGGSISFPALATYAVNGSSSTITATGASSKLSLASLTTVAESGSNFSVVASSGGDVELPALNAVTFSGSIFENLTLQSSGTSSVINAPLLGSSTLTKAQVTVATGGTLNWGSPTTLTDSSLTLNTTGTLNTSSLASLTSVNLSATNGAVFSFPAVTLLATDSNFASSENITANGSGSKLQLTGATTLAQNGSNASLSAQNGGDVELPALSTLTFSGSIFEGLSLTSAGSGSLVNVPSLASAKLIHLSVDVATGGTVNWGAPTTIADSSLTLDTTGTLNTAAIANLSSVNLTATNGSTFSFPVLLTIATDSNFASSENVTASTSGSKLLLNNLTAMNQNGSSASFSAQSGGDVEAPNLNTLTYSGSIFEGFTLNSTGTGSLINVPSLAAATLTRLTVTVATGGTINWGSPTTIADSSLTMNTAGTLNTANLITLTSTNLTSTNGATFSFPAVTTLRTDSNFASSENITASTAGSKLLLNGLSAINQNGSSTSFSAQTGGDVEAPNLKTVTFSGSVFEGFTLNATGTGSVINVPLLGSSALSRLTVVVATGGTINWGSPTAIRQSSITLNTAGTLNTASITNLDSTSLTATNGATLSFPAMVTYGTNSSESATFSAQNTSSAVLLPNVTQISENGWGLSLTATAGGLIDLHQLASITRSGSVFEDFDVTSSNAGSEVNLSDLDTTTGLTNSIILTDNGQVLVGSPLGANSLTFQADFANANGPLDLFQNGTLIGVIQPNNLNTTESYVIPLTSSLASTVELLASGSNSSVTVSNYSTVPEPASLSLLTLAGAGLLGRRRHCKAATSDRAGTHPKNGV